MSQLNTNTEGLQALLEMANALPDAIEIDTTLSQAGMAADAKAVGDAIDALANDNSNHNQSASTITAGTFAGQVVAASSAQTPSTSLLRNSKILSTETNPSNNGEINWTYE